ncbi:MAG: hypothetical protein NDF55_01950 [archaeon GB-1867-005]|nr:hypothetical protein [Candidatus Culexmicrobium cathedralense]
MSSNIKQRKYKCAVCGRRLTRNDLVTSRGTLIPFYNLLDSNGELKPICVKCYHEIVGKIIARLSREELHVRTSALRSMHG